MNKETTKQIVSRIDERTVIMQIDVAEIKKDLNKTNERSIKNAARIGMIIKIGGGLITIIALAFGIIQAVG